MNDVFSLTIKDGLVALRSLLAGKHLRPAELALMVVVVASQPEAAAEILMDIGKQSRWEAAFGEEA